MYTMQWPQCSWLSSFGQESPLFFFFFSEMSLKTNLFIIFICGNGGGKGVHDTYMKIRK